MRTTATIDKFETEQLLKRVRRSKDFLQEENRKLNKELEDAKNELKRTQIKCSIALTLKSIYERRIKECATIVAIGIIIDLIFTILRFRSIIRSNKK